MHYVRGQVKSDRLLDHALQLKTIIQYPNHFAIYNCRFISYREHNVIREYIHSAPSRYMDSVWGILLHSNCDRP